MTHGASDALKNISCPNQVHNDDRGDVGSARSMAVRVFQENFGKSIEIYRQIGTHQKFHPTFLQRNLWYMRVESTEVNQSGSAPTGVIRNGNVKEPEKKFAHSRRDFKRSYLSSLLSAVERQVPLIADAPSTPRGYSSLKINVGNFSFGGLLLKDESSFDELSIVFWLNKRAFCKRKNVFGTVSKEVVKEILRQRTKLSSSDTSFEIPAFCFSPMRPEKETVEYKLEVEVRASGENEGPSSTKKRKLSEQESSSSTLGEDQRSDVMRFMADFTVYSFTGECQLPDGEYEFTLKPLNDVVSTTGRTPAASGMKWIPAPQNSAFQKVEKELRSTALLQLSVAWTVAKDAPIQPFTVSETAFRRAHDSLVNPRAKLKSEEKLSAAAEKRKRLRQSLPSVVQMNFVCEKKRILGSKVVTGSSLSCVFCTVHCRSLYALLKHMSLCHARLNFVYSALPGKGASIEVTVNYDYDGSFNGNPAELSAVEFSGALGCRREPRIRSTATWVMMSSRRSGCKPTASLSQFLAPGSGRRNADGGNGNSGENGSDCHRTFVTGHRRLYYRTITCLPVPSAEHVGESDDETDPDWLKTKTHLMIDDFTDVNEGEKSLMKAWNLHVLKHYFAGDCHMDLAVSMFLNDKIDWIISSNLSKNFCCLLQNMCLFGLIKMSTVLCAAHAVNTAALARKPSKCKTEPIEPDLGDLSCGTGNNLA
ncbi:unnamed protein product [Notodromas monacha]|uniref:Polycomb protein VEFS-Box domain-containing protein n=1 Tax=Notodromas monacha TaxID=399045 RepID=A0A7R9BGK3_9CRUS|nr:unnamed protein product [Notodromas monacha]CAG0914010.1 unnamed protein product [Notodromas monacha]